MDTAQWTWGHHGRDMGTPLPEGSGARGFLQVHELTADCSVLNEAGHESHESKKELDEVENKISFWKFGTFHRCTLTALYNG